MSTSLRVILKRFAVLFLALAVVIGILEIFAYDVIKIDWVSFMEISPAQQPMENPLPVPARSIPIEGPVSIPDMGPPVNPVPADAASIARVRAVSYQLQPVSRRGREGRRADRELPAKDEAD